MDNPIAEAYVKMLQERKEKEESKLDPVGQADADIDNDGDTDSSDEYLHKRRKAIKKSMKKEENEAVDEVRQLKDPKKEVMVVDKKGKTVVIDKSKQAAYLAKGWKLAESVNEAKSNPIEYMEDDQDAIKGIAKKARVKANFLKGNHHSHDGRVEYVGSPANIKKALIAHHGDKETAAEEHPKLFESTVEETDAPLIAQIFSEARGKKLSPDDIRKALASKKAQAKGKDKVSLKKAPWESTQEGIDIETDDTKTDVDDPKAKKKTGEKKSGKGDPAAVNAPSQDDRAAAADAPDPSPDPDAEPTPPKEKEAPAPKKDKVVVKKKPATDEKEESVKKESFNWNEISEMNDEQVDAYIDSLDESQLDAFELEMNEAANPEGEADQQDKEQLDFIRKHSDNAHIVDRPDADKPKDSTKVAAKRPGDNDKGDKKPVKRMKDVRK